MAIGDRRHLAQQRQGEARAGRGGGVDDGAPGAPDRDRPDRRDRGLRYALCRRRACERLARDHEPDLHRRAGRRHRAVRAGSGQYARNTSPACSTAARSGSSRRMSAPPRRPARWSMRRSFPRSAAARPPAPCRICSTARSRSPKANAALNDATMVMVQFENAAALARAEEIVAVDGVDMVMIGINDLLADWGMPEQYDHPRVREAYAQTIAACRKHGKHVRRRRPRQPAQAGRRVRADGRALRLDRHRPRASSSAPAPQRAKQVRDI